VSNHGCLLVYREDAAAARGAYRSSIHPKNMTYNPELSCRMLTCSLTSEWPDV
jgi:hypothetical protein